MDFANPLFMAAGGALVTAPILIHLINRMRFKRVRWAAMEFLLKSQKRNRRKLIIEQLVLLALRCLLVMLVGFLLGRFRLSRDTGQNAFHLAILDDTPSMGDRFNHNGVKGNAFEEGKNQVLELARSLSEARNGQQLRVALLSDLDHPIFDAKVDATSLGELKDRLDRPETKLSFLHVKPIKALEKALAVFKAERERDREENRPSGNKYLHFVSDFRESDWKGDAAVLGKALDAVAATGAYVSLMDVASPFRDAGGQFEASNPNLSLQELRAASTIAIDGAPVEFTVGVYNHSDVPKTAKLHVFTRSICLDDHGQLDESQGFNPETAADGEFAPQEEAKDAPAGAAAPDAAPKTNALPPHQLTEHKFKLVLKKKQKPLDFKDDKPDVRLRKRLSDAEFVQVRVQIEDDPSDVGLAADNVRDLVVALERSVPVLVVDGAPQTSRKVSGDLWYLRRALESSLTYQMDRWTVAQLDANPLDRYPDVILVNVPELKEETIRKLADYVAKGGGLAYFLGDQTEPKAYNRIFNNRKDDENKNDDDNKKDDPDKRLYDSPTGEPLFPVLLELDPSKPMSAEEAADRRVNDKQPKILFPDESHPIVRGRTTGPSDKGGLVKLEDRLRFLTISRYWPCQPRLKWDHEPYQAQEVAVLPNRSPLDQYKPTAQDDMASALALTKKLAESDNKKFAPYVERLKAFNERLNAAIAPGKSYLDDLIAVLDDLMNDPGVKEDPKRPNMPELWAQPDLRGLKDKIDAFRTTLQYGDPLVVTRPFGKGRVAVFLTTAGTLPQSAGAGKEPISWNDWAGSPIAGSYPVFINQMQDYLISTSEQRTQVVGADVTPPELEAKFYQPEMSRYFQAQTPVVLDKEGKTPPPTLTPTPVTLQATGPDEAQVYRMDGQSFTEPGVYVFAFSPNPQMSANPVLQAYAFNMDAEAESDLTRAPKETLLPKSSASATPAAGDRVALRSPDTGSDQFKEEPPDLSSMVWLFLLIGLVFIVEQALAVHLSFHLKEGEAAGAAAPAPRRPAAA